VPYSGRSVGAGIAGSGKPQVPPELRARLEDEVGDLFFVLVNIARFLSLDPESALRKTNRKFKRRFQWMEERIALPAGERRSRRRWTSWKHYGKKRSSRKNERDGAPTGNAIPEQVGKRWPSAVTIRKCEALAEMQACFALQKEVWKFSDADLVPVRMFVVAAKIGGQVIGAFVRDAKGRQRTARS
jgi:hypothetical protein